MKDKFNSHQLKDFSRSSQEVAPRSNCKKLVELILAVTFGHASVNNGEGSRQVEEGFSLSSETA